MTREKKAITLSLEPHQKQRLEQLALAFGLTWGEKANVSALIQAIADGRLMVVAPEKPIPKADHHFYRQQLADLKTAIANLESLV